MFIEDGAGAALGKSLGKNAAVVPAWFGVVASLNAYSDKSARMNTQCTNNEPMGRAAAIAVCDEGVKARASQGSSPHPTCLEVWWLPDTLVASDTASPKPVSTTAETGECPDTGDGRPPFPKWHR
jgi:hypothetical protein